VGGGFGGIEAVLAIGDMVRVRDLRTASVVVLPGVAPVAMQQGRHAARLIRDRLNGRSTPAFRYRDKGQLATVGRMRAVADLPGVRAGGSLAWLIWLTVHVYYLIGFENRAGRAAAMGVLLRHARPRGGDHHQDGVARVMRRGARPAGDNADGPQRTIASPRRAAPNRRD
jgi:NADH dehydrogenase